MSYWARPSKRTRRGDAPSPRPKPKTFKTPSPTRSSSLSMSDVESAAIMTAQHLRDSGWRDTAANTEIDEENTFCTCRAHEDTFDIEEVVKCLNRGCRIEFFHLTCMNLLDHPPRGIGWNCPTCRVVSAVDVCRETGLYDQRNHDGGNAWRMWMRSEGREVRGIGKKSGAVKNSGPKDPTKKSQSPKKESESPKKKSRNQGTIGEVVSPMLKRKRGAEEEEDEASSSPELDVAAEGDSSSELTELELGDEDEDEDKIE